MEITRSSSFASNERESILRTLHNVKRKVVNSSSGSVIVIPSAYLFLRWLLSYLFDKMCRRGFLDSLLVTVLKYTYIHVYTSKSWTSPRYKGVVKLHRGTRNKVDKVSHSTATSLDLLSPLLYRFVNATL